MTTLRSRRHHTLPASLIFVLIIGVLLAVFPSSGSSQNRDWQKEILKYAEEQDWTSALRVVDQEISHAPNDTDVRAWRARILTWSGHLAEAEQEYLEILSVSRNDPDNWVGLANVYLRESKAPEALAALDTAVKLDANRADLHAARARVLRIAGIRNEARTEFQNALNLDPSSEEARVGLISLRAEPKHELRFGQENDLFNFATANHNEWTSLTSRWTSRWSTGFAGSFYQRAGMSAGKFVGSVTRRQPKWGAVTVGGATGYDSGVIPRSEVFFDLDRGWKAGETTFVRSVETIYGQHWYWYQSSRILTLTTTAIVYLPREWTFSLAATGARSGFTGSSIEWRPSGIARLGFPIAGWGPRRLGGNIFFGAGTEDFGQVDQIGSFASQTYGGGLRYKITARQDLTGYGSYQKRTQDRTDMAFGLSYGIHF
jgi:tetratricopeptide (TPR) repeat protein